jgi:hypothetical protein
MDSKLINCILSTFIICIPETGVISLMALFVIKKIGNLTLSKLKTIFLIFGSAIVIGMAEIINLDPILNFLLAIIVEIVAVYLVAFKLQRPNLKHIGLTVFAVFGGILFFVIGEALFGLPPTLALGLTTTDYTNNVFLAFAISFPERFITYTLIYIIAYGKFKNVFFSSDELNVLKIIFETKSHRRTVLFRLLIAIVWNGVLLSSCASYGILNNLPLQLSVFIIDFGMILPILPIISLWKFVYSSIINQNSYITYATQQIRENILIATGATKQNKNEEANLHMSKILDILDSMNKQIDI